MRPAKHSPAQPSARDKDNTRLASSAFAHDELAAQLLATMPLGKRLATGSAAEFLAGAATKGIVASTWKRYLTILKAHDSETRKFYEVETGQWLNKGG